MRKIINIAIADNGEVVSLCDDGTCWIMSLWQNEKGWRQLPAIPQPDSATKLEIPAPPTTASII